MCSNFYSLCTVPAGMRPLPEAYRELAEMAVDITKFKHWSSSEKPIPAQLRNAAYIHSMCVCVHVYVYVYVCMCVCVCVCV